MKYLVRAVKYFFYFVFLLSAILVVLMLLGMVGKDIGSVFRNGYDSLWQIAAMFAVVSAFYPRFGFMEKDALLPGGYDGLRDGVIRFMEEHGYALEREEGENLTFRQRSVLSRLSRMLEDRITFTRQLGGFSVEGLRRDVVRLVYGLEYALREQGEEEK